MAQYRLYCIGASRNSYKLALYLNCAGLDWEPVGIDFASGVQRDAAWRAANNAMGEVPVLEVAGRRMSQSGAILTWLAETTGKFAVNPDDRFEALRWMFCRTWMSSRLATATCVAGRQGVTLKPLVRRFATARSSLKARFRRADRATHFCVAQPRTNPAILVCVTHRGVNRHGTRRNDMARP